MNLFNEGGEGMEKNLYFDYAAIVLEIVIYAVIWRVLL